jgi:hypothetical protein
MDRMLAIIRNSKKAVLIAAAAACPVAASAQIIDFGQADVSSDTQTLILLKALPYGQQKPDPLLSAAYTHWQDGWSASVGYMYRWGLTGGDHKWSVGAGAGADRFVSEDDNQSAASARAQTELSGPAPGGNYFLLAQLSTFRRGVFALAQYNLADSPLGFEVSHYNETGHHHTTAAVRYNLGSSKWFLRAGLIAAEKDQPFIGVGYNGL